MKYANLDQVQLVYAMTYNGLHGNPAGVVLNAKGISDIERQLIANEAAYSETAFLEKKDDDSYALAFFTPTLPIAYCGHATVATFGLLRKLGLENRDKIKVLISGTELFIHFEQDQVLMDHAFAKYEPLTQADCNTALEALGIQSEQINSQFAPQIVSTGNRFMLISLQKREDLAQLKVDLEKIHSLSEKLDLIGFYVFTQTQGAHIASCRMFAPRYGIPEESATGMAAGPLISALVENGFVSGNEVRILQGEFMNPPQASEIVGYFEVKDSRVTNLKVGGRVSFN